MQAAEHERFPDMFHANRRRGDEAQQPPGAQESVNHEAGEDHPFGLHPSRSLDLEGDDVAHETREVDHEDDNEEHRCWKAVQFLDD